MTPEKLQQVEAAKAALPKTTPGPWIEELCLGGAYVIDNVLPESKGKVRHIAEVWGPLTTPSNATLIAAAPVLVERVIELEGELAALKEWQAKAVDWVCEAKVVVAEQAEMWKGRPREEEYNRQLDEISALIAQAQGGERLAPAPEGGK